MSKVYRDTQTRGGPRGLDKKRAPLPGKAGEGILRRYWAGIVLLAGVAAAVGTLFFRDGGLPFVLWHRGATKFEGADFCLVTVDNIKRRAFRLHAMAFGPGNQGRFMDAVSTPLEPGRFIIRNQTPAGQPGVVEGRGGSLTIETETTTGDYFLAFAVEFEDPSWRTLWRRTKKAWQRGDWVPFREHYWSGVTNLIIASQPNRAETWKHIDRDAVPSLWMRDHQDKPIMGIENFASEIRKQQNLFRQPTAPR